MELEEIKNLDNYKRIHLIGIGGISMSAIAETLKVWGHIVTGSDLVESELTEKLVKDGIEVVIGHDVDLAAKADLIIYNAAIKDDDPEIVIARINNIPLIGRGKFVGYMTKRYKDAICISGTHGKTSTTSMIACCLIEAGKDPSVQVGAILKELDGNYRIGNSDIFVLESCEYKANFLNFIPNIGIVLNIDNDHLDYYKTFENIVKAFQSFVGNIEDGGYLVTNADDENCLNLKNYTNANFVTYGVENKSANFTAENISFDRNGFASYDCLKNGEFYMKVELSIAGKHNVSNSLCAIAVCDIHNLDKNAIAKALKEFTGASRRLEYKGTFDGVVVYDDYAHHPTEIKAIVDALKNKEFNESWVIFQSHTYSRTKALLKDFAKVLSNFDNVIITDIYAAREKNDVGVYPQDLVDEINKIEEKAIYIGPFEEIVTYIKEKASNGDLVLTLGAGTVTEIGPMFFE